MPTSNALAGPVPFSQNRLVSQLSESNIGRRYIMSNDYLLRHFFSGFVRLHLLYHAAKEPICGIEMIEELGRHGYRLSPGTLYPILHNLHENGYLSCKVEHVEGRRRKNYRITKKGRKLLAAARSKLKELFLEVVDNRDR